MKTVIFCGGRGTRLQQETEFKPKPMVTIGKYPILWHIMKIYGQFGHKDFVLALGYKGDMIKDYFYNYKCLSSDFTLNIKSGNVTYHNHAQIEDWNITFADTGLETKTVKRLFALKKYLKDDDVFCLTYGDGVADVDINKLLAFHKEKGKIVTLTGINPTSQYGVIDIDSNSIAKEFKEKPKAEDDFINGGFMVVDKRIFNYLKEDDPNMLEETTLRELAKKGEVAIYRHRGFWQCMDTYRDFEILNNMWNNNQRHWAVWEKK
jgi:glucose-1-phosphate cytidylyltransferase